MIYPGISREDRSISGEARRKITPDDKPGIIKKEGGESFRWNLSKFSEDKGENNGKEKWLKNKPSGTEYRLLILGKKIPAYKKVE